MPDGTATDADPTTLDLTDEPGSDDARDAGGAASPLAIDIHLASDWWRTTLEAEIRAGLSSLPREIPAKWLYDERGSQLFDEITRLPEYYPFRAEREILQSRSHEIVAASEADTLVELGSGTSEKSRVLLDAMADNGLLRRYVPFDVSEEMLRLAAGGIAEAYPGIEVHGVVGDFDHHIPLAPVRGRGMIGFFGSTIGNLDPNKRAPFLLDVAAALDSGGTFLVGTDLVKDPQRLWAAYNDSQGISGEFNLNVLRMLNRELGATFELDAFEHAADWDAANEWIDIRVRNLRKQRVRVADLDLEFDLEAGEEIRTEISAKFHPDGIVAELAAAGLELVEQWTDAGGDYAMTLARKP
ncbi:MAG: L-histidine N(alpha)-methyltransferase [Actinomycetota bacterium]